MSCRMICLDIDGTILNSHNEITEITSAAIERAMGKGILVVLVSARMPAGIVPIATKLHLQNVMVCYGGAFILENGIPAFDKTLAVNLSRRICRTAKRLHVHISVYRHDSWIVEKTDNWSEQESAITGLIPLKKHIPSVLRQWDSEGTGPNKLLFMADANRITELKNTLGLVQLNGSVVYRSKPTYLEVVPENSNKQQAVAFLCERYGIRKDDVVAIGDSENDIDMIRYAGVGIAMGNALDHVKSAADFVTLTNDDNGVAFAVSKFV